MKSSDEQHESKEEEENFYAVKDNYNPILNAPLTEEQKDRMNKFRNFLIQDAKNISTQDLLENIANVITNTYTDEIDDEIPKQPKNIFNCLTNPNLINNFFKVNDNDSQALENNRVVSGNRIVEKETKDTSKSYSYKIIFTFSYYYRGVLCYSDKPVNTGKNDDDSDLDD